MNRQQYSQASCFAIGITLHLGQGFVRACCISLCTDHAHHATPSMKRMGKTAHHSAQNTRIWEV